MHRAPTVDLQAPSEHTHLENTGYRTHWDRVESKPFQPPYQARSPIAKPTAPLTIKEDLSSRNQALHQLETYLIPNLSHPNFPGSRPVWPLEDLGLSARHPLILRQALQGRQASHKKSSGSVPGPSRSKVPKYRASMVSVRGLVQSWFGAHTSCLGMWTLPGGFWLCAPGVIPGKAHNHLIASSYYKALLPSHPPANG